MQDIVRCPECKERIIVDVDVDLVDEDSQEITCSCGCYFEACFTVTVDCREIKVIERGRVGEEKLGDAIAETHKDRMSGSLFPSQ